MVTTNGPGFCTVYLPNGFPGNSATVSGVGLLPPGREVGELRNTLSGGLPPAAPDATSPGAF